MIRQGKDSANEFVIFYEVFNFPVEKLRKMTLFSLKWRNFNTEINESSKTQLLLPKKDLKAEKVISSFWQNTTLDKSTCCISKDPEFRILAIKESIIRQVVSSSQEFPKSFPTESELFIEEIPDEDKPFYVIPNEQTTVAQNSNKITTKFQDQLVQCVHMKIMDFCTTYQENPFFMLIRKDESVKEFKDRLSSKLDISKSSMTNWRLYKLRVTNQIEPKRVVILDKDTLSNKNFSANAKGHVYLGMDHQPIKKEGPHEKLIKL